MIGQRNAMIASSATGTSPASSAQGSDLLDRVRAGDAAACAEFVKTHEPRMLATSRRFLRCDHDCADAVQEAFISAFRALPGFEGQSSVSTWLHRIVVNACLMKLRSKSRRDMSSIDEMLPDFADDGHHARSVAAWPDELVAAEDESNVKALVRQSIDQLPESYRTVLILRDMEDLDTEKTAELLGISESNVKVRLHRARLALQSLLNPYFGATAA